MPLIGVIFYLHKSPRYIPQPIANAKIIATILLTVVLPILLFLLLKSRKKISSIYLPHVEERVWPLIFNCFIVYLVLNRIFPLNELEELYFFFIGILISTLTCLILALFKFKASIHMVATGGVLLFFIALSLHFSININGSIALMVLITGAVATSRLHLHAHDTKELIVGFLVGLLPQMVMLNYWL